MRITSPHVFEAVAISHGVCCLEGGGVRVRERGEEETEREGGREGERVRECS